MQRLVEVPRHFEIPALVLYHILDRRWYTDQLKDGDHLPTLLKPHYITVTKLSKKVSIYLFISKLSCLLTDKFLPLFAELIEKISLI